MEESESKRDLIAKNEKLVEECSWFYVAIAFFLFSAYSVLHSIHATTADKSVLSIASQLLPIAAILVVMTFMMKPTRTDRLFTRFFYFHFVSFAIFSEIASAVHSYRRGQTVLFWFTIFGALFGALDSEKG